MEHASDYAADITRHIIMLNGAKQTIPNDVLALMISAGTEVAQLYVQAVEAFFTKDVNAAVKIMKFRQKMDKIDVEITSRAFTGPQKSAELVCGICSIRDNIKRIAHCTFNIAETAVNRAFKVATPESLDEAKIKE
jgi:phosphate uptake regulator